MGAFVLHLSGLEYEVTWALSVGGSDSIRPASQDIPLFVFCVSMAMGILFLLSISLRQSSLRFLDGSSLSESTRLSRFWRDLGDDYMTSGWNG